MYPRNKMSRNCVHKSISGFPNKLFATTTNTTYPAKASPQMAMLIENTNILTQKSKNPSVRNGSLLL